MTLRLYLLQRATAAILALLVLVHLAVIAYAVQGGLSAGEILSRTRGSLGWGLFYGLFVVMVAVHGSIGLHGILIEWARLGRGAANGAAWASAAILLALGLRAVWVVTGGGAA
jgi:fumarate reductase subunit C